MSNLRKLAFVRPVFLGAQSLLRRVGIEVTYPKVTGIPDAELYSPMFEPWRSAEWRTRLRESDRRTLVPLQARYVLHTLAEDALRRCDGELAECGVYRGGTSHILAGLAKE